ncbi:MAG: PLP-dependent aminotransferase family protein [Betaproteobacteria bacterium]|nr:PLP-dependent aminotransferase family protein [Betaproteobacteria bacterium]MDE2186228.1 PLP-dependent aminotransferase family protein [Betaproteobacteria bacterium]
MRSYDLAELLLTELHRADNPHHAAPLNRRLYQTLRSTILGGRLTAGTQLPSTRDLARDLDLSRNTVMSAVGQLVAEGYLTAQQGSGTYVSDTLPDQRPLTPANASRARQMREADANPRDLSQRGGLLTQSSGSAQFEVQPFAPGAIEFTEFPIQLWQKLQAKYWRSLDRDLLDYGQEGGYMPLRVAIAQYLTLSRSVRVTPEQVLITSGTQQSIDLAARLLTDHGDEAWVENPCYWGARRALQAAGLQLRPIGVDADGIAPTAIDWQGNPRLIYVTPSHQYPLGHVMSLPRRRALLEFAARRRCWIFEDDYDSEFRYTGRPYASLQGLDEHAQVLYSGTFSKVMYPGIRLGYLVVPKDLVPAFNTGLYDLYRPGQLMLQAALTDFITEGHLNTLIRRLRVTYQTRRDVLARQIQQSLGGRVRISGQDSGLHLCLVFQDPGVDDQAIAAAADAQGMTVRPLSRYSIGEPQQQGLILGYAYVPTERVAPWAKKLCELIRQALD